MKRVLYFSFLLFSFSFLLQSCQQEITDPNAPANVTGDFRAKIDGVQWVADKSASASRIQGRLAIAGLGIDKKTIAISLADSGVHRYILSDVTLNAGAFQDSTLASVIAFTSNGGTYPTQAGGEVNVTSIDTATKKISGTFFFKAYRPLDGLQRVITEGSFTNIPYTTTLPPSNNTDTFRVKIAGNLWVPTVILASKTPAIPPLTSQIIITGTDAAASKSAGLIMPSDITPGNYTFNLFGGTYIGQYNPDTNPANSQGSSSGTLTIASHNTTTRRITGTFNFHAETLLNPLIFTELTEGYFSVTY